MKRHTVYYSELQKGAGPLGGKCPGCSFLGDFGQSLRGGGMGEGSGFNPFFLKRPEFNSERNRILPETF